MYGSGRRNNWILQSRLFIFILTIPCTAHQFCTIFLSCDCFLNIVVVPVYKFQITIINLWLPGLGAVAAATGVAESLGALPLFFAPGGAMATHRKGAISLVQHEFCSYTVYWPMGNRRLFAYFKISKYGSRRFMNRPAASPPACGPVRINGK